MPESTSFFQPKYPYFAWVGLLGGFLWFALFPALASAQTNAQFRTGNIQGEVRISKKLPTQRMRFRLYPDFKPVPPPSADELREDEWQNVVIYLKSIPWTPTTRPTGERLEMVQKGETFIPHVLPIVIGSTVSFPNQDPIFHNVFSLSGSKTFDLGRYPRGDSRSVTFDTAGIVPVFCHLHSDMSAIILVLDNPYFTVPQPDGSFEINDIPAGSYTLVAWHERSETVEQQVEVTAGQTLVLDLTVPIEDDDAAPQ
jgi:plastocyanin